MASTSTLKVGLASCWTWTSVLAGVREPKYRRRTSATAGVRNSEMSVTKIVILATWLKSAC